MAGWAYRRRRPWRVFLSYTSELGELPRERPYVTAAETAVMRAGHAPIGMHHFPASDQDPADYSRVMVGAADVWVGLISLNYGSPVRGGGDVSYTELEFETATDLGRPRLVFLVDDDGLPSGQDVERQRAFRRRLQGAGLITVRVSSPVELEARLFQALVELAQPPRSRRVRIRLLAFAVICACLAASGLFVLPRIPRLFAPTVSAGPPNVVTIPGDGTAATPTQADTGACAEHAAAGFEMGVCINDRHVTGELFPDVYVNQQPPDPLHCTLTIEVWDGSGHRLLADEGHPCADGHWVARQVGRVVGGCSPPLHTSVWIETAGRMVRIGDSPAFVYCD